MLPASTSNAPASRSAAASSAVGSRADRTNLGHWQIGLAVGLMLYAFALGGGLLANVVRADRAFLLFAVPCLVPLAWCAYGYWKVESQRDAGLLLSLAGWLLIALAFIFKHVAVVGAGADAYASQASSPFVPIFGAFGIFSLLAGAVFSWVFWASNNEDETPVRTQHY